MKFFKKSKNTAVAATQKEIILQAVNNSARIEGLSLKSAQANKKVIAELQKHGRAFSL